MINYISIRRSSGFLVTLILALFCTSCFNYEDVEVLDIKDIEFENFSEKGVTVSAQVKIYNPNNFSFKVVDSEFDLIVKNQKLGKASIDNKLRISGRSEDYHLLVLKTDHSKMNMAALPGLLSIVLSSSKTVDLKIKGHITGKAFLFKKKVDIDHKTRVPLSLN